MSLLAWIQQYNNSSRPSRNDKISVRMLLCSMAAFDSIVFAQLGHI
jgi:hypothetical protein